MSTESAKLLPQDTAFTHRNSRSYNRDHSQRSRERSGSPRCTNVYTLVSIVRDTCVRDTCMRPTCSWAPEGKYFVVLVLGMLSGLDFSRNEVSWED